MMPDMEKVIRAWECCNPFNRKCNECPYEKDCYHDGISRHMVADALALLKEQEAVEPFHRCIGKDFNLIEDSHFDYCPYCGKPITWAKQEGR